MDRPRLVIGSNIFDSVEDASESTSTITGTIFVFGNRDEGLIIEEGTTQITANFRIVVNVDDQADLNQGVLDVLTALDDMKTDGIEFESDVGERIAFIDPAGTGPVKYSTKREPGYKTCTIEVALEIEALDTSQFGRSHWQVQRNSAGRMFVVGTLLHSTRAAAVAAARLLYNGARPVWMPSTCRPIGDLNEFEASSGTISTLADASYRPGEIAVTFEQVPAWLSSFTDLRRGEFKFSARLSRFLNVRAGNLPPLDVEVRGSLEFKTEADTTYDVGDSSKVEGSALKGKAIAIANAAKSQAETRLGLSITPTEPVEQSVTGEDGVYEFIIHGVTGGANQVLEWDEQETYVEAFRGQIVALADGSDFEFEHPGGDEVTLRHTVRILSIGGTRGYPSPQTSLKDMRRTLLEDDPVQVLRADATLPRRFEKIYRRSYTRVKKGGSAGGVDKTTTSGAQSSGNDAWQRGLAPGQGHVGQFG